MSTSNTQRSNLSDHPKSAPLDDERVSDGPGPVPGDEELSSANEDSQKQSDSLDVEVSYFSSVQEKGPTETMTLRQFVEDVRSRKFCGEITEIQKFADAGHHEAADKLKRRLPAVCVSGCITEGGRSQAATEGRLKHSGYLQGDFDAKDFHPRTSDEVKEMLANDEHVQIAFKSPKDGIKVFIRISVCETPEKHRDAFHAAAAYFEKEYNLILDPSTKDPARLCFFSYDPDIYVKPFAATPLAANKQPPSTIEARKRDEIKDHGRGGSSQSPSQLPIPADMIRDMLSYIPPRPEYDDWIRIASAVWHAAGNEELGTNLLIEWSAEEKPDEYSELFKNRLKRVKAGTLVHLAREHGYRGSVDDSKGVRIPDDVFPLPTGKIDYRIAGEKIFSTIAKSHRLFVRNRCVYEVIADRENASLSLVTAKRFCSLVENFDHRIASLEYQESKDGEEKPVWRSKRMLIKTAEILLCSDAAFEHLPPIRQVVACPIITPECEILSKGYHSHAGGIFVSKGEVPPEMPLEPARESLLGLFRDFNFVTAADKSRAVASLLSPALKMGGWIEDDFPMDVAEASASQSGKTYRQKLTCETYNERFASITAPKGGVGSLDEAVSAAMMKGCPFINLDNFRGKLDSTILEQAIRGAGRVLCRALRASAEVDAQPFVWQLTTNGAEFTRDIANRSIIIRINKQPGDYPFQNYPEGDLLKHVKARQDFYLGAIFSILREWHRQNCKKTAEARHDFRGWCQSLDWIVQNIFGLAPLLDGHREEQARTANPALQWLREITKAVETEGRMNSDLTTSDIVQIAENSGIDFPGFSQSREEPPQRAGKILGRIFRECEGDSVDVDGLKVIRSEATIYTPRRGNESKKIYRIEKIEED